MEVHNLDIISVTSNNPRIDGSNSMIRELDSLIPVIFSLIAMVDKIGEGKVKVHIYWSIRKLKKCH